MMEPTSRYTFVTLAGQRKFFHRWYLDNNEVIECNKCGGTTCQGTDAYHKQRLAAATAKTKTKQKTPLKLVMKSIPGTRQPL